MMFWFIILIALLVGIVGTRKGFFVMWATLFNVMISVYLGIMLTPLIVGTFVSEGVSCYCCAGCVGGIALLVFIILEIFTYYCFFKKGKVIVPWVLDTFGAGILGFISGYIACSFLFLVIGIMPTLESPFTKSFFNRTKLVAAGKGPVIKSCNFVDKMSLQFREGMADEVVGQLTMPTKDQIYNPRRILKSLPGDEEGYEIEEIGEEEPQ